MDEHLFVFGGLVGLGLGNVVWDRFTRHRRDMWRVPKKWYYCWAENAAAGALLILFYIVQVTDTIPVQPNGSATLVFAFVATVVCRMFGDSWRQTVR